MSDHITRQPSACRLLNTTHPGTLTDFPEIDLRRCTAIDVVLVEFHLGGLAVQRHGNDDNALPNGFWNLIKITVIFIMCTNT